MVSDFKVNSADLRSHAQALADTVAPGYGESANTIRSNSQISAPGFGLGLIFLEAAYHQRIDFTCKDLDGAKDVVTAISDRLKETADTYDKAETLNVEGYNGTPNPQEGYGSALGQSGVLSKAGVAAADIGIPLALMFVGMGEITACGSLCPGFIPAVIASGLLVSNFVDIAFVGGDLKAEAAHITGTLNNTYNTISLQAAGGWTGAGKDNFLALTNKVKGHLDEMAKYIEAMGDALHALALALGSFWVAMAAFATTFLVWLIAMRAAEAIPFAAAVIEPVIEATGAVLGASVLASTGALIALGGTVLALLGNLVKELIGVTTTLPDEGQAGTPDMTEFKIEKNFQVEL